MSDSGSGGAEPSRRAMRVDAILIGTGQANPPLARALAGRGEQVVVFDGGTPGGSCVNVGCTPTKALRASARIAHLARRARDFGVGVGAVQVDFEAVLERAREIVRESRSGLERSFGKFAGLSFIPEYAAFEGRDGSDFVVGSPSIRVTAPRVYLNTGTRPFVPPIAGLADVAVLTNESVLQLPECPSHLLIVGGSYIGLEFAQIFRRLGSEVTVVEEAPTVAVREDPGIVARIEQMLAGEGVRILSGYTVANVAPDGARGIIASVRPVTAGPESAAGTTGTTGTTRAAGDAREIRATHLLIATGRTPNSDSLALERVGIARDDHGFVPVDGALETNVKGVWALGDVNRRGAFTHTSYQDHEIVLANYLGGGRSVDARVTTYAMYTDPPLGRVGMTEREARDAQQMEGRRFLVAQHAMQRVSRATEEGETIGEMRVIVDADTRRFAGASLLGIRCDEVVQVIGAMMAAGAPCDVLAEALPIHPTVTEFFPTILGKLRPLE